MTLPIPRLRHIRPGETFILRGESKPRILLETDHRYGYFDGGFASLCCPILDINLTWGEYGWRTKQE